MTANLYPRYGTWRYCLIYEDINKKRRQKWVDTELPVKGNKRRAGDMESDIVAEWKPILEPVRENALCECTVQDSQDEYCKNGQMQKQDINNGYWLFSEYLIWWLDEVAKKTIQESTYSEYSRQIRNCIAPYFEEQGVYLETLTDKHIADFYESKETAVTANTLLHYHANIRKALQYAVIRLEKIPKNPADFIERPKKEKFISLVYSEEDLRELFSAIGDDYIFPAILLDSMFGLRRSELCGLKWSSVDFSRKCFAVRHSAVRYKKDGKYRLVVKPILKNKSSFRTLPLNDIAVFVLKEMQERQQKNRRIYKAGYNKKYLDQVFVDDLGNLIHPDRVSRRFKYLLKKHGLKTIRFHDLRHTCATLLLDNNVSLKDISAYLGHNDIGTTANLYLHRDFSHHMKTAEVAGGIIVNSFAANPLLLK